MIDPIAEVCFFLRKHDYWYFECLTIGVRVMANKMTTMKFKVEKFNGKNNFI